MEQQRIPLHRREQAVVGWWRVWKAALWTTNRLGHLPVEKPGSFALSSFLCCPIIVQIKDLLAVGAHSVIVPPNAPRTATRSHDCVCGAHVVRHTTPAAIVVPLVQFLDHLVCLSAPHKPVGTTWLLFQHRRLIELRLYWFTDESKRFDVHIYLVFGAFRGSITSPLLTAPCTQYITDHSFRLTASRGKTLRCCLTSN